MSTMIRACVYRISAGWFIQDVKIETQADEKWMQDVKIEPQENEKWIQDTKIQPQVDVKWIQNAKNQPRCTNAHEKFTQQS